MAEYTGSCPALVLPLSFFLVFAAHSSTAADTMDRMGSVRDGATLVSAGGRFELGFFTPGGVSTKKYLCVRFIKSPDKPIVWVANRVRPLNDSAGVLKVGDDGNLVVLDEAGGHVWSTKMPPNASPNPVAQLLDSGNFVLRDAGVDAPSRFLWQSFDEPGDTLLPGMKLVVNTRTGASRQLTSWRSADDPSPGKYSYGLEVDKLPQIVLREGPRLLFTMGLYNGVRFTGFGSMNANSAFNSSVVSSGDEVSYSDTMIGDSSLLRLQVVPSGGFHSLMWYEQTGAWRRVWSSPTQCESFAACGPHGTCTEDSFPLCRCLRGFRPKSPPDWSQANWTEGCVRETRLGCGDGDAFLPVPQVKLPQVDNSTAVSMELSLEECRDRCAKDCSCTAYATADIREGGRGCITWSGDLVDVRNFSSNGQVFFLRVAASDVDPTSGPRKKKREQLAIVLSVCILVVMVLLVLFGFRVKKKMMISKSKTGRRMHHHDESANPEDTELPLFDFETISSATNNFSIDNKIGEGGFGIVYKGILEDGQDIAVKRLSMSSGQGASEFMNEVILIVKLQHKNLVRLLCCCIRGDERMLIYEYLENKSLDSFIFDETRRGLLGWNLRLDVISGIARGLVDLHHDSRFKIIHRDLKAGNILLDGTMNPKISDFGTARSFGADQLTENTKRVIGTYGYMAPEYAINGIISIKSDVFSFGVLVLEVLSGMKSRGIYETEPHLNLLSHAWKLWQEGNCLELLDAGVTSPYPETKLLRCIQIGLLCVQQHASDRPTMSMVVLMLGSENFPLPQPKKPGFLLFRSPYTTDQFSSSNKQESSGTNELTITGILEGR